MQKKYEKKEKFFLYGKYGKNLHKICTRYLVISEKNAILSREKFKSSGLLLLWFANGITSRRNKDTG